MATWDPYFNADDDIALSPAADSPGAPTPVRPVPKRLHVFTPVLFYPRPRSDPSPRINVHPYLTPTRVEAQETHGIHPKTPPTIAKRSSGRPPILDAFPFPRQPTPPLAVSTDYFVKVATGPGPDGRMTTVEQFESGHHDRVTALHVNFDGTKILTASIDHKIKVWTRNAKSGEMHLIETFSAHDGNIKDAKWFHPATGCHIASVGDDRLLRIFQEQPDQMSNNGRRFPPIAQISSKSGVPFVSLDIKNVESVYTYVAVIDRQGLLTVYQPVNPDDFKEWATVDQFHVCTPPGHGEETSFKVRFDPNLGSLAYLTSLSDESDTLNLVVTAVDHIKIYRSVHDPSGSRKTHFYEAASFSPTPKVLIRDVQWAPFNIRGVDLLATASRDGTVALIEMNNGVSTYGGSTAGTGSDFGKQLASSARAQPQSSLTTAIAGRNTTPSTASTRLPLDPNPSGSRTGHIFPYSTSLKIITTLSSPGEIVAHPDAWALSWDPSGQVLMSSGSEGITKLWKQSTLEGEWKEFASNEFEIQPENDDEHWGKE